MKKFFKEFKEFICRGNIMDLAVAVIIGGAFSAIVTAFTNKIIMPVVNYILSLGGDNGLESSYTFLKKVYTDGVIDLEKSIYIDWGAFITAIIDFLIIALVIFLMIKLIMNVSNNAKKFAAKSKHELTLKERRALKKQGLSRAEIKAKEQEAYEARIAKEAAEKAAAANKETTESLLKEIRDMLAAQNKTSKKDK